MAGGNKKSSARFKTKARYNEPEMLRINTKNSGREHCFSDVRNQKQVNARAAAKKNIQEK